MVLSLRYDRVELRSPKVDSFGILRCDAVIGRVGVQEYWENGKIIREFRSPEQVRDGASSFSEVPYTTDHPPEQVTSTNSAKYLKGLTGVCTYDESSGVLRTRVTITDAEAVKAAQTTHRYNSCGYICDSREEPGEWVDEFGVQGERGKIYKYDRAQYAITGNHVAGCQSPRAGKIAALKLDSVDSEPIPVAYAVVKEDSDSIDPIAPTPAISTESPITSSPQITTEEIKTDRYITRDEFEKTIAQFSPSKEQPKDLDTDQPDRIDSALTTSAEDDSVPTDCNREDNIQMKKWKGYAVEDEKLYDAIVGMESEMESMRKKSKKDSEDLDSQVESLQSEITQLKQKVDAAETERDKAQVKADMLQPEIDRLKTESANRIDSNQVGEIVKRHLKVWDSARPYLGKETKLDAASQPIEMMKEAIKTRYPNLNMENRKDEAIETAFEMLLQEHPVKRGDESTETAEISMSKLDELMTQAALGGHAGNTADPTDRQDAADDREKLRQKMAEQIEMNGKGVKK